MNMAAGDVEETLQMALNEVYVTRVKVKHRPRLLSDNGPAFLSQALKEYLKQYRLCSTFGVLHTIPCRKGRLNATTVR
jgi:putative transposase